MEAFKPTYGQSDSIFQHSSTSLGSQFPALQIPKSSKALRHTHQQAQWSTYVKSEPQVDRQSLAHYVRSGLQCGWLPAQALSPLEDAVHVDVSLHEVAQAGLEAQASMIRLAGAIDQEAVIKAVEGRPLNRATIGHIVNAGARHGLFTAPALSKALQAMDIVENQFIAWWLEQLKQWLMDHGASPIDQLEIWLSPHIEGASLLLYFEIPEIKRLNIPTGNEAAEVQLRDCLLLLLETLSIAVCPIYTPANIIFGDFGTTDEVMHLSDMLGENATYEQIFDHITQEIQSAGYDSESRDGKALMKAGQELLADEYMTLHSFDDIHVWCQYIAILLDPRHWLHKRHLPEEVHLAFSPSIVFNNNEAASALTRDQAYSVAHEVCVESVDAIVGRGGKSAEPFRKAAYAILDLIQEASHSEQLSPGVSFGDDEEGMPLGFGIKVAPTSLLQDGTEVADIFDTRIEELHAHEIEASNYPQAGFIINRESDKDTLQDALRNLLTLGRVCKSLDNLNESLKSCTTIK